MSGRPILVTGVSFAVPQFVISNFINPWIVDIGASLISMGCADPVPEGLAAEGDLDLARAARQGRIGRDHGRGEAARQDAARPAQVWSALLPWIIVCVVLLIWGTGWFKTLVELDLHLELSGARAAQHDQQGAAGRRQADARKARCSRSPSCPITGTGMLIAAIISGLLMGFSPAS